MSRRRELKKELQRAIGNLEWAIKHVSRVGATMHDYGKLDLETYAGMIVISIEEVKKAIKRLDEMI